MQSITRTTPTFTITAFLLATAILCLAFPCALRAQGFGIFAGANALFPVTDAVMYGVWSSIAYDFGWTYGIWTDSPLSKTTFLRFQLMFSQRNLQLESETYGASQLEFSTIDLLVLYEFKLGKKKSAFSLKPVIGLYGSYLFCCIRYDEEDEELGNWTNSWESNWALGPAAGLVIDLKPWSISVIYSCSIIDMGLTPTFYYHTVSLCLGVIF